MAARIQAYLFGKSRNSSTPYMIFSNPIPRSSPQVVIRFLHGERGMGSQQLPVPREGNSNL